MAPIVSDVNGQNADVAKSVEPSAEVSTASGQRGSPLLERVRTRVQHASYTASSFLSHLACGASLLVVMGVVVSGLQVSGSRTSGGKTIRGDDVTTGEFVKTRRVPTETIVKAAAGPSIFSDRAKPGIVQSPPLASPAAPVANLPSLAEAWSPPEVSAATLRCSAMVSNTSSLRFAAAAPMRAGACGDAAPVTVTAVGEPSAALSPAITSNCALAGAVDRWVSRVLQPAAREMFGTFVVSMEGTSSYVCRNRNGASAGPISEHAFANAFDVSAFKLADGRTISVSTWGATIPSRTSIEVGKSANAGPSIKKSDVRLASASPQAGIDNTSVAFLKRIHREACGLFGTVLGPSANEAHRDHLHFDMKTRGTPFCE